MATQSSYSRAPGKAFAGTPGDSGPKRDGSYLNDEGSDIPAGIAVTLKAEGKIEEFDAASDVIAGVTIHTMARDPNDLAGSDAIKDNDMCNVREMGAVFVLPEETVAVGDPVYVRHTSDGSSNTQLGKFRKSADSARARLVPGARWLSGGTTSSPALLHFDADAEGAAYALDSAQLQISLSAAAEAANAIVVSGVVKDMRGVAVASAKQVLVRTLAVTADKGDISVTAGTSKKIVNPATGENVAWIETTAAGAFAVSVANDAAEETLIQVSCDGALVATLKLTFA